jgi:hypothetical protein
MSMRQRLYAVLFALVLVAIVVGAFFGGRFVVQRFRQDFSFRQEWSPPALTPVATNAATTVPEVPTGYPTNTPIVIPTPIAPSPEPYTPPPAPSSPPADEPTAVVEQTGVPTETAEVPTSEPVQASAEPFQAKAAVRYSQGDCGGTYVVGFVTDRAGNPLPGIRLRLVDEYDNQSTALTKAGQADLGRFDFPVAGPPRRFSIAVVDESGSPLSRFAGFAYYGDSPDAQATCYWIDWQRR